MEMETPKIQKVKIIVEGKTPDIIVIMAWLEKSSKQLGFKYRVMKNE